MTVAIARRTMTILCVAEKNDAARQIATILSGNNFQRREGKSVFNKIYQFASQHPFKLGANQRVQNPSVVMTSVSGHLLGYEFRQQHRKWHSCSPIALFDAPLEKGDINESGKKIRETLEREVRRCDTLVLWTDCDREGENIAYEIVQVCRATRANIPILRARFSDLTHLSIVRAAADLQAPNPLMSEAVDCRQELDLRIGAAFTRFQTLRLQRVFPQALNDKLISYGSCQFPTLGFVVERYKAVDAFISEPFWRLIVRHTRDTLETEFRWSRDRLFDKDAVGALHAHCCNEPCEAHVTSVASKPAKRLRPLPLDTVEMEKLASQNLKISPAIAMRAAERLYNKGFISYPRTETNKFPPGLNLRPLIEAQTPNEHWGAFARRILDEQGGPQPRQGKKSDEAHPPIHPTQTRPAADANLSHDERRMYELITRHFLACCSADATGLETKVQIELAEEAFVATGLRITARNFLEVYPYRRWAAKEIGAYTQAESFRPDHVVMEEGATTAPPLLSESDLITLMDRNGIGTDATHAEHIETVKSRLYVGLTPEARLQPGFLALGLVEGYDAMGYELSKPHMRASLERDLQAICDGRKMKAVVLQEQIAMYRQIFEVALRNVGRLDAAVGRYFGNQGPRPGPDGDGPTGAQTAVATDIAFTCSTCVSHSDMTLQRCENTGTLCVRCTGHTCSSTVWLPGGGRVTSAEVLQARRCSRPQCSARQSRLIRFTLDPSLIDIPAPRVYEGCLLCDRDLADWFGFDNAPPVVQTPTARTVPVSLLAVQRKPSATGARSSTTFENATLATVNAAELNDTAAVPKTDVILCNCGDEALLLQCKNGKNKGKEFYKCGSHTRDCNFFMWNEVKHSTPATYSVSASGFSTASPAVQAAVAAAANGEVKCFCGLSASSLTVKKEGPNKGKKFHCCSKQREDSSRCEFFSWDNQTQSKKGGGKGGKRGRKNNRAGPSTSTGTYTVSGAGGDGFMPLPTGGRAGRIPKNTGRKLHQQVGSGTPARQRKCGLCQQPGHTRKNCPNSR